MSKKIVFKQISETEWAYDKYRITLYQHPGKPKSWDTYRVSYSGRVIATTLNLPAAVVTVIEFINERPDWLYESTDEEKKSMKYNVYFNRGNNFVVDMGGEGYTYAQIAARALIEYAEEARYTVPKALRLCDQKLGVFDYPNKGHALATPHIDEVKEEVVRILQQPPFREVHQYDESPIPIPNNSELIAAKCDQLKAMLLQKNADYGNSALDPVRIFSTASTEEQIRVRIDDKLSRLSAGGDKHFDEDTVMDLAGYLILLMIKMEEN